MKIKLTDNIMSIKEENFQNIIEDIFSMKEKEINKDNDLFDNSFVKIDNVFKMISNKLDEIEKNKEQKFNSEFTHKFEELKKSQIEQINTSSKIKKINYLYLMQLLNSRVILYNFLNDIFLEKYVNIKDKDEYNILNNISYNVISNYNILADILIKLLNFFEIMNEEIISLKNENNKKAKYIRQINDKRYNI